MISRRKFLRQTFLGGSGLALGQMIGQIYPSSWDRGGTFAQQNYQQNQDISLPPRQDLRLVVLSDLNGQYGSVNYDPEVYRAIALTQQWQPDLVLCCGDMVAAQSNKLSTAQVQAMWNSFDRVVAQPLKVAQIPFGFTLGNHDASGYRSASGKYVFERDRELARAYWQKTYQGYGLEFVDDRNFPFYYSFKQGKVFYLAWDASTAQLSSQQLEWVKQSLANAQDAALRIVIGHLPLYSVAVGRNKPGEILNDAEALHKLLVQYGVHTYISGHHHAYYPGEKNNLKLLYAGLLGGGPKPLIGSQVKPYKSLTVVDVNLERRETRYTTIDLSNFRPVDSRILPEQIKGVSGTIYRQQEMVF